MDMLEKVRALLAKAENKAATPEESETYTAKAMDLMARYGIEQALIDAGRSEGDRAKPVAKWITLTGAYVKDQGILLNTIRKPLRCEAVSTKHWFEDGKLVTGHRIHIIGMQADVERVEMLFTSLLLQAFSGMRQAAPPAWVSAVTYRKGWLSGFISRVGERLHQAERRAADDSGAPGTALVLADRTALVEAEIDRLYPNRKPGRTVRRSSHGKAEGRAAANRADLGEARLGDISGRRSVSA